MKEIVENIAILSWLSAFISTGILMIGYYAIGWRL